MPRVVRSTSLSVRRLYELTLVHSLNHPLTIESDWHLIATVELMAIRGLFLALASLSRLVLTATVRLAPAPLHLELSELPENAPVGVETFSHLQQANQLFEKWYKDWLSILGSRFKDANKTYEERLRIQRSYAELFHNCSSLPSFLPRGCS